MWARRGISSLLKWVLTFFFGSHQRSSPPDARSQLTSHRCIRTKILETSERDYKPDGNLSLTRNWSSSLFFAAEKLLLHNEFDLSLLCWQNLSSVILLPPFFYLFPLYFQFSAPYNYLILLFHPLLSFHKENDTTFRPTPASNTPMYLALFFNSKLTTYRIISLYKFATHVLNPAGAGNLREMI